MIIDLKNKSVDLLTSEIFNNNDGWTVLEINSQTKDFNLSCFPLKQPVKL